MFRNDLLSDLEVTQLSVVFSLCTGCDNQLGSEQAQDQTVDSHAVDSKSDSEEGEEEEDEGVEESGIEPKGAENTDNQTEHGEIDGHGDHSNSFNDVMEKGESSSLTRENSPERKPKGAAGLTAKEIPKIDHNAKAEKERSTLYDFAESHSREARKKTKGRTPLIINKEQQQPKETQGDQGAGGADSRPSPPYSPPPPKPATDKQGVPWTVKGHSSSSFAGNPNHNSKYKYSCKLSPPVVSPSAGLALPNLDRQMALVMSSMPLALLAKGRNCASPSDTKPSYFPSISGMSSPEAEDQPLDLSKKANKEKHKSEKAVGEEKSSSFEASHQPKPSTSLSAVSSLPSSSVLANGFSSLQSLQQRFGGDFPIEATHSSGASVIPLQPSLARKSSPSSATTHALGADHSSLRTPGIHRFKQYSGTRGTDWLERHEKSSNLGRSSSSPPTKPERKSRPHASSPLISPVEDINETSEGSSAGGDSGGSKHTIHRCSCHKTFSSLYGLSVHLQETGHAPGASRSASLMDYPKLVRGQDMWLNQESEQTRRILRCMQCGESFKSLPLLTVHMMQTQHYTKIVSSEHGRRSHKCSTYCDRELDKECIFKCKVCHEAFTDMEGLANHMIVSGHHKKQSSSRHVAVTSSQSALSDVTALARHGRRKRFLREDVASAAAAAAAAAADVAVPSATATPNISLPISASAVLDFPGKQNNNAGMSDEALANGFHDDVFKGSSSSSQPISHNIQSDKNGKTVLCDSCGKRYDALIFDAHVRACLRQRAEVIDALKSKLAVEEALLSKSESKLLRSGFTLSSSSTAAAVSNVDDAPEERLSVKSEAAPTCEPDNFLGEGCSMMSTTEEDTHSAVNRSESRSCNSPAKDFNPSISQTPPRSALETASPIPRTKICDLIEVPLKKWYCSQRDETSPKEMTRSSVELESKELLPCSSKENHLPDDPTWKPQRHMSREGIDADRSRDASPNVLASSPYRGQKRKMGDVGSPGSVSSTDSFLIKSRAPVDGQKFNQKEEMAPGRSHSPADSPTDFTSSALHKLDMFSRGLKLSPPRRTTLSPEGPRQSIHHPISGSKTARRREMGGANRTTTGRRESSTSKSPLAASISPVSIAKSDSSPEPQRDVTFDILDPNIGSDEKPSSSSAIEAMESFIHKSFSAKSDLRTSNLATMFSPFRTCFPLPGSLPGHMPADPTDPALSCFAKFSKFFRMVPGAPPLPDIATPRSSDQKPSNSSFNLSSSAVKSKTNSSLEKQDSNTQMNIKSASFHPLISPKTTVTKPFLHRPLKTGVAKIPSGSTDSATSSKRYKYSSLNPEEVAKQMLQGNQCQTSHYPGSSNSVYTSTPLAASCNRISSSDFSASSSALPSTSELEKIKSDMTRKRKLSSSVDPSEGKEARKAIKEDEKCFCDLRSGCVTEIGGSKNGGVVCENNKNHIKLEASSEEVEERKNRCLRLSDVDTSTPDRCSPPCKDNSPYIDKSNSPQDGDFHIKLINQKQKVTKPSESRSESSLAENKYGDSESNCIDGNATDNSNTECHSATLDNDKNEDNESEFRRDNAGIKSQRIKKNRKLGEDSSAEVSTESTNRLSCTDSFPGLEKPKDDDSVKFDTLKTRRRPHSIIDSNENEATNEKRLPSEMSRNSCSNLKKEEESADKDSTSLSSPLPIDEDGKDGESGAYKAGNVKAICLETTRKIASRSSFEKSNVKCEDDEISNDLLDAKKPFSPPTSSRLHGQCPEGVNNDGDSDCNGEEVEADKDNLQSGRSSASSLSSFSSTANTEGIPKVRGNEEKKISSCSNKNKSSALDSLSSFVYSQPLTSEHPLDSLQKLLSTNDLLPGQDDTRKCMNSLPSAAKSSAMSPVYGFPASRVAPASSPHCNRSSSPLNLSTMAEPCGSRGESAVRVGNTERRARISENDVPSDSEENEEDQTDAGKVDDEDDAAGSGGASDNEASVYKCAACNRQFASKGSYRYHLSRCHLSSVKKLGIKEAFNMSPYVYLPLDHSAKFSKYYQMAHELANKGK